MLFLKIFRHHQRGAHGFNDASEEAYAGVVYIRSTDIRGTVHIVWVISKTKVAPITRISIPRLELCGAVVVTRLLQRVRKSLSVTLDKICAWTEYYSPQLAVWEP